MRWTHYHWLAVALCLLCFLVVGLVAQLVFEQIPHLEDEGAYLFQARVFSVGRAYVPSPSYDDCFSIPFVIDYEGRRFGKYPPGWPALLVLGVLTGQLWWVNAACTSLTIALIFRLGSDTNNRLVGIIAAGLAVVSPFVLLLSGSLMSEASCLLFTTAFLWCFRQSYIGRIDRVRADKRWRWACAAGMMLGCAFAIRPFTTVAIGIPAGIYVVWRMVRQREWQRAWFLGLGFMPLALSVPYFNALWTGNPLFSPYELVWSFDRIGFGLGYGTRETGHSLWIGLANALWSVGHLATQLHGWPTLSLSFVLLFFVFKPRRFWNLFLGATVLALSLASVLYWTNNVRYLYGGASALFILSAGGLEYVGRWAHHRGIGTWRTFGIVLAVLMCIDLFVYLPQQLLEQRGVYGITAQPRNILKQANLHNALVIVRWERGWQDYAVPFSMNAPTLDSDVVYAKECPALVPQLLDQFSNRRVYYFNGETVQPYVAQDGEP
jgi:4-amino-4-deoxy-L-arabinose transferase-like glycosyltransferase